jgi:hypothetical protein
VLHNILLDIRDDWNEEEEWWTSDEEDVHENELAYLNSQQMLEKLNKRDYVKKLILENVWLSDKYIQSFLVSNR